MSILKILAQISPYKKCGGPFPMWEKPQLSSQLITLVEITEIIMTWEKYMALMPARAVFSK